MSGTVEKQAWVKLTFWCELPEDEGKADTAFDNLIEAIEDAVDVLPGVLRGSVASPDADTVQA